MSRCAANGVAELELGRYWRGKECISVKYWLYLLHANVRYIVRNWYKWEVNNLKMDKWQRN